MKSARAGRRLVAGVVTLLAVMFPALTAGAGLDQPVRPSELRWIELAAKDPKAELGGPASLFVRSLLDVDAASEGDQARRRALGEARLASMLGILACSGLLYLAVTLSRGRGVAILSCVAFGLLPPVWSEGAILRPEVPCTVFGLLGLLLLVGMPERLRTVRRGSAVVAWLSVAAIALAVATAEALAVATLPTYGVHLLVPAACLLIAVVQQSVLFLRVLRRFRFLVLPFRGFFVRTFPWLLPAFFSIVVTMLVMRVSRGPDTVTQAEHGLIPASPWLALPVLAFAVVGGLVRMLQVGLRIGRRARIGAEAVLAVHVLALLLHRLRLRALDDALPAAAALAVLVAEGAGIGMLFAGAKLGGLERRPSAAR